MSELAVALGRLPFPGAWTKRGACRHLPTSLFFPGRGEEYEVARAACGACPVMEPCRSYALEAPGLKGIWGGLSENERKELRRATADAGDQRGSDEPTSRDGRPEQQGLAASPKGTLYAHLEQLLAHEGRWARVARYNSKSSAAALASLLRRGRRPVPPGRWRFEGRVDDRGGSELWACYDGLSGATELFEARPRPRSQ